jgi:predicted NUDIX family phosphoesterase
MRWKKHPWKRTLHPQKSPPRKVVLPEDESPVLTNGQDPVPGLSQEVQEVPGGDPERILVFPSSLFSEATDTSLRPFTGFRSDVPEMAVRLFPRGVSSGDFRPRTRPPHPEALEADRRWKQVVACVVPWHAASRQVWTFRRGSSEGRLEGKVSCLIGGHVNFHDAYPELLTDGQVGLVPEPDILDVTFAAALRELGEELSDWEHNWKANHSDCRLVCLGVVHDDFDPVGAVHFGFIYRLDVTRQDIPMKFAQEAGEAGAWIPVDVMAIPSNARAALGSQVEPWSVHVARHLAEKSPVRRGG